MRVAYRCGYVSTLCWARRLLEEGTDVLVYMTERRETSGEGIVPITHSQEEWLAWGALDPSTIYFFDMTHAGKLADQLRASGKLTINGGSWQDRLEFDRDWGESIVKEVGILAPPTYQFPTITAAINFLQSNPKQSVGDGGWAWKASKDIGTDTTLVASDTQKIIDHVLHIRRRFSDQVKCIVQEKIKGIAVSTARWWNGVAWVGPISGAIEQKKFMNDNLGPATGCQFNVVWFYWDDNPRVRQALKWDELANTFRKHKAPPGLYDINSILNKDGAWFLEWTPRLGVDSEMTGQRGITNLSKFMYNLVHGLDVEQFFLKKYAYFDVTLSIPPYPLYEPPKDYKSPAVGVPVKGIDGLCQGMFVMGGIRFKPGEGFSVGSLTGNVGCVVMAGNSLKKTYEKIYDWIKETLVIPDIQYRTDAVKVLQEDIDKMIEYGWETTPALRR